MGQDFYAKAADATFLQGQEALGAEMVHASNAPYKGMQSESGGIMGFLEVILSDFARLEADTGHKRDNRQDTDASIVNLKKELQLTQEELDAALAYFDKLKPDCVDQNLSYGKRVLMREEEI